MYQSLLIELNFQISGNAEAGRSYFFVNTLTHFCVCCIGVHSTYRFVMSSVVC